MTTVIVLLLGLAGVLVTSAVASNPDGSDLSVLGTIQNIWQGKVDFTQNPTDNTAAAAAGAAFGKGVISGGLGTGPATNLAPLGAFSVPNNAAGGPSGNKKFLGA